MAALAAVFFAPPAAADAEDRRAAADYHALFDIREITAPVVIRADGSGRCRVLGVAHILFRGDREFTTGQPMEIVLRCRAGGSGNSGAALYDHTDPAAPTRLIVWLNRFEDRLVVVDWVAPAF